MVYYFKSNVVSPSANIYVGKDKFESACPRLPKAPQVSKQPSPPLTIETCS